MAYSLLGEPASLMRFMMTDEEKNMQMMEQRELEEEEALESGRCLMPISQEAADGLRKVLHYIKMSFHIGFLPLIIFLGWRHGPDRGNPPFSITNFFAFY